MSLLDSFDLLLENTAKATLKTAITNKVSIILKASCSIASTLISPNRSNMEAATRIAIITEKIRIKSFKSEDSLLIFLLSSSS
jgi:hypothetical protein